MVGASHHSHSGVKGSVLTSTSSVQDADGNVHATTLRDRRNALTAEMIWTALNEASRDARELAEEVRASDEELRRNGIPFSERVGLLLPLRQRQLEKERQITALRELETAIARERLAHVDRTTCMCFLIPIVHNHSCTIQALPYFPVTVRVRRARAVELHAWTSLLKPTRTFGTCMPMLASAMVDEDHVFLLETQPYHFLTNVA